MRFLIMTERTPGKLTKVVVLDNDTQKPVEVEGFTLPTLYVTDNKDAVQLGLILVELLSKE